MKYKTKFYIFTIYLFYFTNSMSVQTQGDLLKQINIIRLQNGISAAVVIVVNKNATIINSHLGTASWKSQKPMQENQMFRIGSISKSFVALLALRMQQSGIIDLKNNLIDYLPKTENKKPFFENTFDASKITLGQLLEHTAGLIDLTKAEWDYNDAKPISLKQAFAMYLGKHKTRWPPGLHSSYSNVGAGLLGLALEKAGKQSYEDLMQEYVFTPLGMKNSALLLNNSISKKLISGYNTDGESPIPYWHNIYRPFAAINTDSSDMIKFLQIFLNQGKFNNKVFLANDFMQRIETPHTTLAAKTGLRYGYGLANYTWQYNGYTFHGHGGDADGYLSRFGYNKESGLAYFVLINAFNNKPLTAMRHLLENYLTQDLPKPQYPQRLELNKETINLYAGKYAEITNRFGRLNTKKPSLEIMNKNNKLYVKYQNNAPHIIYAVTKQQFRYGDESIATMAFVQDQQDMFFQGDIGNFKKLKSSHLAIKKAY